MKQHFIACRPLKGMVSPLKEPIVTNKPSLKKILPLCSSSSKKRGSLKEKYSQESRARLPVKQGPFIKKNIFSKSNFTIRYGFH